MVCRLLPHSWRNSHYFLNMLKDTIHKARFTLPDVEYNIEGEVLVFDKPYQCTSFDVVSKLKSFLRRKYKAKIKVGHAGTLDPLATGVLIVCIGKCTKQIDAIQAEEKEYTGTIRLGATTPSFDLELDIDQVYPYEHITSEDVLQAAQSFVGEIAQIPPHYSAIKIDGKRAYDLARKGEEAEIKAKNIHIYTFEITRMALPDVDFKITCSKGTYVRSIARDFGKALGSGGHLTALRRTRSGNYRVDNAIVLPLINDEAQPIVP